MEDLVEKRVAAQFGQVGALAVKESSVQFMLAEYSRIQESESYARSSGETRFNIYLTLVSLISAALLALWQSTSKQAHDEMIRFYVVSLISCLFLVVIGLHTFRLFISRWRLTIIYLRKLARIRGWFVGLDPFLRSGLVYSTDDTKPTFLSRRFFSASLATLVGIFNCIFMALSTIMAWMLMVPQWITPVIVSSVFVVVAVLTWFAQRAFYVTTVNRLERDKFAAFPEPEKS